MGDGPEAEFRGTVDRDVMAGPFRQRLFHAVPHERGRDQQGCGGLHDDHERKDDGDQQDKAAQKAAWQARQPAAKRF
jgi:hypothetical protein